METHPFAKRVPVQYIKGTFQESLTDALLEQLRPFPPALVTIDVDYYTSTLESLSWLDRFIASGALLRHHPSPRLRLGKRGGVQSALVFNWSSARPMV